MSTPRTGSLHTLNPVGLFDLADPRVSGHTGHQVRVIQPHGCPRNGSMGHVYAECLDCGSESRPYFIGLVRITSLAEKK